ncbi:MAG: retroviral-like aspartic protease family protein [Chloroflexi bacterium]|nr:retroviral-like aspartic protease family protein [Chloroflexota bacterium]MBP8055381.1 retroviral-like aspartic protease family protein [Chloroflexota bacterium]
MSISFNYSRQFDPTMPIVEVSVRAVGTSHPASVVTALVDSGADATILPLSVLQQVGARYVRGRVMRGVTGIPENVDTYLVSIQIGPYTVHGIRAVAYGTNMTPIIGRDVLNNLVVTLDGLAQETVVSE